MKTPTYLILILSLFNSINCGGIHRIAQSSWNANNEEDNSELFLYFVLDSDV